MVLRPQEQMQNQNEAAAAWVARKHEGLSEREEERFLAWLAADPANKRSYDRLAHGWAALDSMSSVSQLSIWRSEALLANPPRRRFMPHWAAIAASVVFVAGATFVTVQSTPVERPASHISAKGPRELRTVKGERSTAILADGSTITLNTDTQIRVAFSPTERRVVLIGGQAYFQVAHDKLRPFIVSAGDREIVAVGTEFEVRVENARVRVSLAEGKVRIRPQAASASHSTMTAAVLRPGEQLVFLKDSVDTSIKAANVAELTRWREGQVRFDAVPLREAVSEMNRYSSTPIVIDDPQLGTIMISGVFQTGQSREFVAALTELFPVTANATDVEIRLRKRVSGENHTS